MLLDKAIAAKGGLAKLKGVRTVRSEGTMTSQSVGKPVSFPTVTSIEYPDRYRVDAETPGGKVAQVYADGRYWVQDDRGTSELPPDARGPIRASVQRDIIPVLLKAAAGALVVREVGHATSRRCGAIEISGDGMPPLTLLINRVNGLIEKARYVVDAGRAQRRGLQRLPQRRRHPGPVPHRGAPRRAHAARARREDRALQRPAAAGALHEAELTSRVPASPEPVEGSVCA